MAIFAYKQQTTMRIVKKFISLTKRTYPHGTEAGLTGMLPAGYKKDPHGNYYAEVGQGSTTMFTCHLDTADRKQSRVKHVFEGNFVRTDGRTILGADDKAGVTILQYMISRGIPGLYYFFIGEEVGCVGSSALADAWGNSEFSDRIKKVVSFDRRGTTSVITHQMFGRCCSDEFAEELSARLNNSGLGLQMKPDDTGILTDSARFIDLVPECTNISVGYYNEHTTKEKQDLEFLRKIAQAACLIDWESLPVKRDVRDTDYPEPAKGLEWDPNNWANFTIDGNNKKMYISNDQIELETAAIWKWIEQERLDEIVQISWNGRRLVSIDIEGEVVLAADRYELMELIPKLASVYTSKLREKLKKGIFDRLLSII